VSLAGAAVAAIRQSEMVWVILGVGILVSLLRGRPESWFGEYEHHHRTADGLVHAELSGHTGSADVGKTDDEA
jgi:hypothetical protein